MTPDPTRTCIAFADGRALDRGPLVAVAAAVRAELDRAPESVVLVFDDLTSEPVEIDFRGTVAEVVARLAPSAPAENAGAAGPRRSPGRPKLGVVAREVTLLPRHWEWLAAQPGGASVTLRKLVEDARRTGAGEEARRRAQEAAFRFMNAVAGNEPGFEEAVRALYAGDVAAFDARAAAWPADVCEHARRLAGRAFGSADDAPAAN